MTCANKTIASVFSASATRGPRREPLFVAAIIAIAEAFREALDMQRAAHRTHPLNEE